MEILQSRRTATMLMGSRCTSVTITPMVHRTSTCTSRAEQSLTPAQFSGVAPTSAEIISEESISEDTTAPHMGLVPESMGVLMKIGRLAAPRRTSQFISRHKAQQHNTQKAA